MMKPDKLSLIGMRILQLRKEKGLSLRELARRSNLSAGLLSKIENYRTIPSLPVLLTIADALEVDVAVLVKNMNGSHPLPYLLVRAGTGEIEPRNDSKGLIYTYLLSQNLTNFNLRVNEVTINAHTHRKPVSTDALELIHVLDGHVTYGLKGANVTLQQGDTLYFDGIVPHSVTNESDLPARLFKVYLIRSTE